MSIVFNHVLQHPAITLRLHRSPSWAGSLNLGRCVPSAQRYQNDHAMKSSPTSTRRKVAAAALVLVIFSLSSIRAATVTVSGKSNPWLAGATNGTTARTNDVALANSPVEVGGGVVIPGSAFSFSATGGVRNSPSGTLWPPDGRIGSLVSHSAGAEHGISDITNTPFNSFVGVFLGSDQPSDSPEPPPLSFGTPASRDYAVLSPLLKEVFFIGDGRTSLGDTQRVVVPSGATRLFLGTMDTFGWYNNGGAFTVDISYTEAPFLSIGFADERLTDVQLYWSSRSNLMYQVEYHLDLTANAWIPLGLPVLGTGTTNLVQDSFLGEPRRYYRLMVLP